VTGLTSNSYYQAQISFIGYQSGTVHSSSTQFRIVTGPQNPPSNPQVLGASPLGVLYVASGGDVVGTLASVTDEDNGDVVSVELPSFIAGVSNDNGMFLLEGNQLKLRTSEYYPGFGANNQSSYSIVLRARDSFGLYADTPYTIVVRQDVSNEISFSGPQNFEYDSYPKSFSASAVSGAQFAIAYQGRNETFYATSGIAPTNAGDYMVTATVTDLDKIGSKSQEFTIRKATPRIDSLPTATTIAYGQALSSSGLSGGGASVEGTFGWTTPSTIPVLGSSSQNVVFTPTDTANYNTVSGASVSVMVALDPAGDEDGDGATNQQEYAAGTDPYDSASGPYQPVAFGDAFTAKLAAGMTTKVTTASLISNDKYSGIPGETRGVTFVSAMETNTGGASIRVKGGWVIYQPSPSAQNGTTDTFTYTVSNGIKTATGTVTVSLVAPNYVVRVEIDRVSGDKVYFSVMPGMTFEVQGTSELGTSPDWTVLPNGSNPYWTSGADGRLILTDPAAVGMASRFYKFRWIP
jgi:hypothetical protein